MHLDQETKSEVVHLNQIHNEMSDVELTHMKLSGQMFMKKYNKIYQGWKQYLLRFSKTDVGTSEDKPYKTNTKKKKMRMIYF